MDWNYFGVDQDPPGGTLLLLTSDHQVIQGTKNTPNCVAWHPAPYRSMLKEQCQKIMQGLPELKHVELIVSQPIVASELALALRYYDDTALQDFVDLIKRLHVKALALIVPSNGNPKWDTNYL